MSLSESFDAESLSEYLTPPKTWFSAESTPPLSQNDDIEGTGSGLSYLHWQEHLLPLSCVSQEDNLAVLRSELETAHQLLQYQQTAIDTLSEQLTNRDLALKHKQDELSKAQQIAHQQSAQISELGAICRDLKMQLRRQQQRVLQYRDLLKTEPTMATVPTPSVSARFSESVVSFGYDSISIEACSRASATKPVPVSAWSAPESIDLTGPLACYRELATIRMTTARIRLESVRSSQPAPVLPAIAAHSIYPEAQRHEAQGSDLPSVMRVELPSFTRTSS
jgi:exonuclease VII large subunit